MGGRRASRRRTGDGPGDPRGLHPPRGAAAGRLARHRWGRRSDGLERLGRILRAGRTMVSCIGAAKTTSHRVARDYDEAMSDSHHVTRRDRRDVCEPPRDDAPPGRRGPPRLDSGEPAPRHASAWRRSAGTGSSRPEADGSAQATTLPSHRSLGERRPGRDRTAELVLRWKPCSDGERGEGEAVNVPLDCEEGRELAVSHRPPSETGV